jgi:hypothetical protein
MKAEATPSPYSYAGSNPLFRKDVNGRWEWTAECQSKPDWSDWEPDYDIKIPGHDFCRDCAVLSKVHDANCTEGATHCYCPSLETDLNAACSACQVPTLELTRFRGAIGVKQLKRRPGASVHS